MDAPFCLARLALGFGLLVTFAYRSHSAEVAARPAISVRQGDNGVLAYTTDEQGNRVIDFSHAGYRGGGEAIPNVPVKVVVAPTVRNDRQRIQAAIDLVSAMPVSADGFRGAVLLKSGRFAVDGTIRIGASGVVLRGSGEGETGTVLIARGNSRRTFIEVGGRGSRTEVVASRKTITDATAPVGATRLTLSDAAGISVGDHVVVRRPSTADWIAALGMNQLPGWRAENRIQWAPGSRDLTWDR